MSIKPMLLAAVLACMAGCDNYRNELDQQGKRIDGLQFQVERMQGMCDCCQCDPCECGSGSSAKKCKANLKPGERQPAIPKHK